MRDWEEQTLLLPLSISGTAAGACAASCAPKGAYVEDLHAPQRPGGAESESAPASEASADDTEGEMMTDIQDGCH